MLLLCYYHFRLMNCIDFVLVMFILVFFRIMGVVLYSVGVHLVLCVGCIMGLFWAVVVLCAGCIWACILDTMCAEYWRLIG